MIEISAAVFLNISAALYAVVSLVYFAGDRARNAWWYMTLTAFLLSLAQLTNSTVIEVMQ